MVDSQGETITRGHLAWLKNYFGYGKCFGASGARSQELGVSSQGAKGSKFQDFKSSRFHIFGVLPLHELRALT